MWTFELKKQKEWGDFILHISLIFQHFWYRLANSVSCILLMFEWICTWKIKCIFNSNSISKKKKTISIWKTLVYFIFFFELLKWQTDQEVFFSNQLEMIHRCILTKKMSRMKRGQGIFQSKSLLDSFFKLVWTFELKKQRKEWYWKKTTIKKCDFSVSKYFRILFHCQDLISPLNGLNVR